MTPAEVLEHAFPSSDGGAQVPAMGWTDPEWGIERSNDDYRIRLAQEAREEEISQIAWEQRVSRSEAVRIYNGTMPESEVA